MTSLLESAVDYYGVRLASSKDLKTDACSTIAPPPPHVQAALDRIHPEVVERYYGCGLIAPDALHGRSVLDLGCGAGRDVYLLSQLVGEDGHVVGVDGSGAQLAVASRHRAWHADRFGHSRDNVGLVQGDLNRIGNLDLPSESFDVVVSNCVFNLVDDKAAAFQSAYRLLKPGGELYFADTYADRRLPEGWLADPVLHGECLAGALYWNDFGRLARAAGFRDPRLVASRPLLIGDSAIAARVAPARFFSATYRLFKLASLESACEDYGQAIRYEGGILGAEQRWMLDGHHAFEAGRWTSVCGNTWRMIAETRFAPYFSVTGDFSRHFGIFPGCGTSIPFDSEAPAGCC